MTRLFVGNICEVVTKQQLFDAFQQFGKVISCDYLMIKKIAFIEYTESYSAQTAKTHLHGDLHLGDPKLIVDYARTGPSRRPIRQMRDDRRPRSVSNSHNNRPREYEPSYVPPPPPSQNQRGNDEISNEEILKMKDEMIREKDVKIRSLEEQVKNLEEKERFILEYEHGSKGNRLVEYYKEENSKLKNENDELKLKNDEIGEWIKGFIKSVPEYLKSDEEESEEEEEEEEEEEGDDGDESSRKRSRIMFDQENLKNEHEPPEKKIKLEDTVE